MARERAQPVYDGTRLIRRQNAKFSADAGFEQHAQRVATLWRPHGFTEQKRYEHRVSRIDHALRKAHDCRRNPRNLRHDDDRGTRARQVDAAGGALEAQGLRVESRYIFHRIPYGCQIMSRIDAAWGHHHGLKSSTWARGARPRRPTHSKCESRLPLRSSAETGQRFAKGRGFSQLQLAINAFWKLIQRLHAQPQQRPL